MLFWDCSTALPPYLIHISCFHPECWAYECISKRKVFSSDECPCLLWTCLKNHVNVLWLQTTTVLFGTKATCIKENHRLFRATWPPPESIYLCSYSLFWKELQGRRERKKTLENQQVTVQITVHVCGPFRAKCVNLTTIHGYMLWSKWPTERQPTEKQHNSLCDLWPLATCDRVESHLNLILKSFM